MPNERSCLRGCNIPPEEQIAWFRVLPHDPIPDVPLTFRWFDDPVPVRSEAAFHISRPWVIVITGSSFNSMRQVRLVEVNAERMLDDEAYGFQAVPARDGKLKFASERFRAGLTDSLVARHVACASDRRMLARC